MRASDLLHLLLQLVEVAAGVAQPLPAIDRRTGRTAAAARLSLRQLLQPAARLASRCLHVSCSCTALTLL